jgi:hypothetical protein
MRRPESAGPDSPVRRGLDPELEEELPVGYVGTVRLLVAYEHLARLARGAGGTGRASHLPNMAEDGSWSRLSSPVWPWPSR